MTLEEIRASGLLELYALGQLSAEETSVVLRHLGEFPELRGDLRHIEASLEAFAFTTAVAPPPSVRQRILDEVGGQTGSSGGGSVGGPGIVGVSGLWRILALILAVVAIGLLALLSQRQRKMQEVSQRVQVVLDSCSRQNQQYMAQVDELSQLVQEGNEILHMTGTESFPQTDLYFYHNPVSRRNFIQIRDLPAIADNQSYQLWSLKPNAAPIPLDVFQGNDTLIEVRFEDASQSYAITIEPRGGQDSPTLANLIGIVTVGG